MFKKLFTMFILFAFCTMSTGFAADPTVINQKSADAFEDNQQDLKNFNSVHKPLSSIEKMYNGKENAESGTILHQVGYDRFKLAPSGSIATGRYDGSYKLSIGEKLNVLSFGDSVDVLAMSGSNLVSPRLTVEYENKSSGCDRRRFLCFCIW